MSADAVRDGRAAADLRLPEPESLYVHFPFCPHRCHYCDYPARGAARPPVDEWLDAVEAELRLRCRRPEWSARPRVETIYVGGGTPSLLGGGGVERLADALRRHVRWEPDRVEWTVEANPESLTASAARRWRAAGVTRVTVGVQSLRREALDWLGRLHGPREARRALETAAGADFDAVNADLMLGLPAGEGGAGAPGDARRIAALGAEHVSLYELEAVAGTPLGRWVGGGRVELPSEGEAAREYLAVSGALREEGYRHYEVTNLARPGHEGRHNVATWDGRPRLGVGPGAHSRLPPLRLRNERRWVAYRNAAREGRVPVADGERIDDRGRLLERIWLSLRRRSGLPRGDPLLERLERDASRELEAWEARGWIRRPDGGVSPTPEGWLHLDDLVSTLAARLES